MNAAAQGSALGDTSAPLSASTEVLGRRYHVLEVVGRGGMGTVYLARDRLAGVVALKRLHRSIDEIANDASRSFGSKTAAPEVALGLADEFKVLTSLHHPHVISVLDYGFDDQQRPYYTMDLLKGAKTITEAGKHQPHEARVGLLAQVLQALAYMHRWGVIHRDLKPGNVLVVDGQVKVLDFGLAIAREGLPGQATVGSPGFVAPELFEGQPASAASDLYSLGMIAYRLFAMPVAPGRPTGLPPGLEESALGQVLRRLSAPDPQERYRSAEEALAALTEATGHQVVIETSATRESFLQGARFVGRERELARLEAVLSQALSGRGGAWLVGGESGVGKSRLLEEVRTLALVRGAVVVRGQAVSEGGIPYQEWRAVLRWLVLLAEPSDFEASVLKPLVEDIEVLLGRAVPGLVEIDPEMAQARLFTVVADLFRRVPQPTVLIIEDQHWAASDSLRLLARLSTLARATPLLILATYRDDERPDLPGELPEVEVLKLPRLDTEAMTVLSESMIGAAGRSPQIVELLRRETEGNPFFLVEVVRSLAEETGQLDRVGSAPLPDKVFPGGVRQIVQRRLAKLPPSARELLQLAAVIGRQIDPKLLRVCAPSMRMDAWLNECASAAVLDVSDGQWRFAHDKLREGVLADLPPRAEPLLHRQAAVAIEALYPDSPDWTVALASHWGKAGDTAKEILYTQKAGEQALAVYACREAIPHLERALALSLPAESPQALKPEQRDTVARLEARLAEAAFQLGHPDRFRVHAERALRHFGWRMPNSPARWGLGVLWQIVYRIAQAAVPEAFEITAPEKQQRRLEAGRLMVRLAEISVYAQDLPRMLWSGLRMLNLNAPVGPSSDLSRGYALMAIVTGSVPPTRPISERWLARALGMAEQVGAPVEKAYALSQHALCGIALARWEQVEAWGNQSIALAQSLGYSRQAEETQAMLACANTIRGRYQYALERLDQVEASARRRGALQTKRWGPIMRVGPLMRLGRSAEAVALLEPELPGIDAEAESSEKIVAYGPLALARLRLGDTEKALHAAGRTLEVLRSIKPVTFFLYPGILGMVEAYLTLWERASTQAPAERAPLEQQAKAALGILRTFALVNPFARPYARLARGNEAWLSGRQAVAREAWRSALAQAERLAMPFEQARARYELGRHMDPQEPARQEHLLRARALFAQMNMVDDVARVQAELDRA
ncbi:ATP-binding protein [Hyalangium rubrum]|uniref:AAA family ATPase n=1 Tax=Hyalangium rubrum TaxID=3103134 RepID=A0ABU5H441_9BACT|nr:AAA family ATPase [Hyalangium sp. s54d21]MDY7228248.1 AAA family ATPase [Hyalangium sp. s54d21]